MYDPTMEVVKCWRLTPILHFVEYNGDGWRESDSRDGNRPTRCDLPLPSEGHSIPVLYFARQLSALGVTVTFVNAFDHIEPKDFQAVEGLDTIRVVGLGGLPQPGDELGPLPMIPAVERITEDFEQLLEHLHSTPDLAPPVCILCDMFLGWTQVCILLPSEFVHRSPASVPHL